MGKNVKKIQIHDSGYSDYFKNQLGKSLTTVSVSEVDTTIEKKSEDKKQFEVSYKSGRINPDNSRIEKIVVTALPGAGFVNKDQFLTAVSSQISGTFLTHDIESTLPYRSQNNNQSEYYYSLTSKYNYYARGYEEQAANVSERLLPNYYIQKSNLDSQKSNFSNANKDFFKSIGVTQDIGLPPINNTKERNIILDNLKSVKSEADQYPMYNEIKFVSNKIGKMTKFLNDQGFMALLINNYSKPENSVQRSFNLLLSETNTEVIQNQNFAVFSLASWVQNQTFDYSTDNITIVDAPERGSFYSERLKKYIFNGILRNYTQKYLRTYEEIVNTEPCYTEPVFYKVDKYVNNIIGDPVQTYWISNKEDLNIILDTQIKYGTAYTYDVKQIVMVLGNSYTFGPPVLNPETKSFQAEIEIINRPSIQLLEIPYFADKIVSIQSPPLRPHVSFSTKMQSDSKIKISLSHQLGHDVQSFKPIETLDLQQLDFMNLFAPNFSAPANQYYFQSDGTPEYYEIYRLDKKPKSYNDFAGNKLKDAKSFFQEKRESSSHVSVNDFVRPNRKYYYMFRAANIHNHVSNPTIVYEVEMIQDADDSKIVVNECHFDTPPTYMSSKRFNSLFQVEPVITQRLLENDQPSLYGKNSAKGALDNIKLGNAEDSIWGRNFKLRITSTTTGRKIDFNINFNTITSKTEEDFE